MLKQLFCSLFKGHKYRTIRVEKEDLGVQTLIMNGQEIKKKIKIVGYLYKCGKCDKEMQNITTEYM